MAVVPALARPETWVAAHSQFVAQPTPTAAGPVQHEAGGLINPTVALPTGTGLGVDADIGTGTGMRVVCGRKGGILQPRPAMMCRAGCVRRGRSGPLPQRADESSLGNLQRALSKGRAGDLPVWSLECEGRLVRGDLAGVVGDLDVEVHRVTGAEGHRGVLVAVAPGGEPGLRAVVGEPHVGRRTGEFAGSYPRGAVRVTR